MSKRPLVSLCIPTNGIEQWVFPVLDSIFAQPVDTELYEVVVMDNGDNQNFFDRMQEYCVDKINLHYHKTDAKLFQSEIACYQKAKGAFIKFLNHRTKLRTGALDEFIAFVKDNMEQKPVVYFSNGQLHSKKPIRRLPDFDSFVRALSYYSSWSTGMGFWNETFDALPQPLQANELFPHTTILFFDRTNASYIVDDRTLLEEIPVEHTAKGRYDLFSAFAIEYPCIIADLLRTGDITTDTFLYIKKENLRFLAQLYHLFIMKKIPCSYDLSSYDPSIRVFYSKGKVLTQALWSIIREKVHNIYHKLKNK
jgi:hypothetical protein